MSRGNGRKLKGSSCQRSIRCAVSHRNDHHHTCHIVTAAAVVIGGSARMELRVQQVLLSLIVELAFQECC